MKRYTYDKRKQNVSRFSGLSAVYSAYVQYIPWPNDQSQLGYTII